MFLYILTNITAEFKPANASDFISTNRLLQRNVVLFGTLLLLLLLLDDDDDDDTHTHETDKVSLNFLFKPVVKRAL